MANSQNKHKSYLSVQKISYAQRDVANRSLRQRFLIVCEGQETEVNYFKAFRVPREVLSVEVRGTGFNTLSLVKRTLEIKEEIEAYEDVTFNQVWCVFDRDSFPAQEFNAAIDLAGQHGIKVAYSNEAFEIWYLLHFDYHISGIARSSYKTMLTKKLKRRYRKNDPGIYQSLIDYQEVAIKNASRLLNSHQEDNPVKNNPSTTVHLLVEALNSFSPDARN